MTSRLTHDNTSKINEILLSSLDVDEATDPLKEILRGIRQTFELLGVQVDRVQVPFTNVLGFQHPLYWGIILTWDVQTDFDSTKYVLRGEGHMTPPPTSDLLSSPEWTERLGPFAEVLGSDNAYWQCSLEKRSKYQRLRELADQEYVSYFALGVNLPTIPLMQFMSIASKKPMPANLFELVKPHRGAISMAIYAAYRASQAVTLAETYVGQFTGRRVLKGEIGRDQADVRELGIVFADIRNFTRMSERVGPQRIVAVMNRVFAEIEQAVLPLGGEILKFIGDAVLIVFALNGGNEQEVCEKMATGIRDALYRLSILSFPDVDQISAGFGAHLGTVTYGNVGTDHRLDYTVMGPNVNLTSRIESQTKESGVSALFSSEVAKHLPELESCGVFTLKGVSQPVELWRLPT